MPRILIIKMGSTLSALAAKKGDFENWIQAGLGVGDGDRVVVDVQKGAVLPDYHDVSGVVITGSHAMVTDRRDWSEGTGAWLSGAVERKLPVLGICYGHQLLAHALGGKVGNNPNGWEFGTVEVHLTATAQKDALLGGLPTPIRVQVSHTQLVLHLPRGARRLASSKKDRNQAFVVGDCAWGVQFHPEFDAGVVREYIHHGREELLRQGQDPEELAARSVDTVFGGELLKRFAAIVTEKSR